MAFISQMSYANGTPEGDNSGGDDKGEKGHPHKSPNEWKKNPYNDKGAYIAPLPETFIKKYVKSLINKIHLL